MIVNFMNARAGDEAFVWKCKPGDEYGWVTDPEWWDDIDEPVETVRQQWQLICEDKVIFHPKHELCPKCHGDGAVPSPAGIDVECDKCKGDGGHPLAGQMEVLR